MLTGFDPDLAARMKKHDEALSESALHLPAVSEFVSGDHYMNPNTLTLAVRAAASLKALAEAIESNRKVYG